MMILGGYLDTLYLGTWTLRLITGDVGLRENIHSGFWD